MKVRISVVCLLPILALCLSSCCDSPTESTDPVILPGTFILDTTDVQSTSVLLQWDAPTGDQLGLGTPADEYDLAYGLAQITPENYATQSGVLDLPEPASPGTQESYLLTGLTPSQHYFVAMRAKSGTWSPLTNVVEFDTAEPALPDIMVNTNSDAPDADLLDGVALTAEGFVSLRAAIEHANYTPGPDEIGFEAAYDIQILSALPMITERVTIDGTNSEMPGLPCVTLDGINTPDITDGLVINADLCVVRGLIIVNFSGYGIIILNHDGNTIAGNHIGIADHGATAAGNYLSGIVIRDGVENIIGGADPLDKNVISGNSRNGIELTESSCATEIRGNIIGAHPDGTFAIPNGGNGIHIVDSSGAIIGGSGATEGNLISGNGGSGIMLSETGNCGTMIVGNTIGVMASGATGLGNDGWGIDIRDGVRSSRIGGINAGEGNQICANDLGGISVAGSGTSLIAIVGNNIGASTDGLVGLGNRAHGIHMKDGAHDNRIGSLSAAGQNLIAYNHLAGIRFSGHGAADSILVNSLHTNQALGIDLGPSGVTANDLGDSDDLQNHPVLTSAISGAGTTITGTVSTQATHDVLVFIYASTDADPTGYGEALQFLGTCFGLTDPSGEFAFTLETNEVVPVGQYVTAHVLRDDGSSSEFSACIVVSAP